MDDKVIMKGGILSFFIGALALSGLMPAWASAKSVNLAQAKIEASLRIMPQCFAALPSMEELSLRCFNGVPYSISFEYGDEDTTLYTDYTVMVSPVEKTGFDFHESSNRLREAFLSKSSEHVRFGIRKVDSESPYTGSPGSKTYLRINY